MAKIRIGDVVTMAGRDEGVVRSSAVAPGRYEVAVVDWADGRPFDELGTYAWSSLTLLRRPVRVGDTLRGPNGGMWTATEATLRALEVGVVPEATHADGTPIEPPTRAGLAAWLPTKPIAEINGGTNYVEPYWKMVDDLGSESIFKPAADPRTPTWEDYRRSWTVPRSAINGVEWSSQRAIHSHPICECGYGISIGDTVRMFDVCCAMHFFGAASEAHQHMVARKATAAANERAANPMIRRPWRCTIPDWLQLVEDHAPVYTTVEDVVSKLARHLKVGAPTVEQIARALFESDDEVMRFVEERSEWQPPGEFVVNPNLTEEGQAAARALHEKHRAAWNATMQTAWTRGHAGESPEWKWYVRAVDRAKIMAKVLGGGK